MNRRDWLRLTTSSACAGFAGCSLLPSSSPSVSIPERSLRSLRGTAHGAWQGFRQLASERPGERIGSLSLTKSIAALAIVRACSDGLLSLDSSLTDIVPEWKNDAEKSRITVRMLVNQSAGFAPSADALYRGKIAHKGKVAVSLPLVDSPGSRFRYGPASWEILAEILHRKLASQGDSLESYIGKIIRRIGLSSPDWRKDGAGRYYLSTGAQFSVRELGKLGRTLGKLSIGENDAGLDGGIFRDLASPRSANQMFGAGIWWNRNASKSGAISVEPERVLDGARDPAFWNLACLSASSDPDWFALVGSGGKRIYVLPEKDLVIVRMGRAYGWNDGAFLRGINV